MNLKKQAFTLVELIVVITILAILATIAFISLSGYSQSARNSTRAADVKTIDKSLQIYSTRHFIYPEPENAQTVSYSGDTVYLQGTFGDSPYKELGDLSNIPVDPLTEEEYIYSVTVNKNQYELLTIYEGEIVNNTILNQTHAAETYKPKVSGTYNKIYVKTNSYYIPLPSLINAELTNTGITLNEDNIKSQIVTNGNNLPQIGTKITQSTGAIQNLNLRPYSGTITSTSSDSDKVSLAIKIQEAYSGSELQTQDIYSNILSKTGTGELASLVDSVVLGKGANTILVSNDTEAPTGGSFTINGGATETNSTSITLNITCPTDVSTPIQVAYGNSTSPTNWITCTSSISNTLTSGDGEKTVYVKFRDSVGNMTSDLIKNITLTQIKGENIYTNPGTYTWTAPSGVTTVSVVCIGGTTNSYFINTSTVMGGAPSGQTGGSFIGDGGGNGGDAGSPTSNGVSGYRAGFGGGGAGGYIGNGGDGGTGIGGGGSCHSRGGSGGGTGIYGLTNNGSGGGNGSNGVGGGGGGGGGGVQCVTGENGTSGSDGTNPTSRTKGGIYGGGAGGLTTHGSSGGAGLGWKNSIIVVPGNNYTIVIGNSGTATNAGTHGGGACRIIWPGDTRKFPSTDVGLSN